MKNSGSKRSQLAGSKSRVVCSVFLRPVVALLCKESRQEITIHFFVEASSAAGGRVKWLHAISSLPSTQVGVLVESPSPAAAALASRGQCCCCGASDLQNTDNTGITTLLNQDILRPRLEQGHVCLHALESRQWTDDLSVYTPKCALPGLHNNDYLTFYGH